MSNDNRNDNRHGTSRSQQDEQRHAQGGGQNEQGGTGQQGGRGFAGMDPDRQREIAAEGGRHSHDNDGRNSASHNDSSRSQEGQGGRGFAGMDPERQREIAAEGGRHSHDNDNKGGRSDDSGRSGNKQGGSNR